MSCRQRPAALVHQRTASVKRTRVSFKSVGEAELETKEVYFSLEAQTSRTATAVDATACCGRIPQASLRIQDSIRCLPLTARASNATMRTVRQGVGHGGDLH